LPLGHGYLFFLPVGAISVHGICGIWGTVAVGIFSTHSIWIQLLGTLSYAAFAFSASALLALFVKATIGIRVTVEEEEEGLDLAEHGQPSYADFHPTYANLQPIN
jgi:Amt family ammonium transporter